MPHPVPHPFERLPTTVVPSHYDLDFKLDLVKFLFEGQMTVTLEVKEATQRIVLNCVDLELRHIELHLGDGTLFLPSKVTPAVECETVAIGFASEIPPGTCRLSISFRGVLDDSLKGFYRSKYIRPETKEEAYCAVTYFEACYAHRCFPCWDEPAIKTTFDISLCVPNNRIALSNMPIAFEEDHSEGYKHVHFETTPVMSTYLVAIVVGEFDYIEKTTQDGINVRVYTPVGKQDQGQFALDVAVKVLPYFTEYFKISYPLPKIDMVAIGSFSAGAMENWGLVTYRETCLLVDPDTTSTARKQGIAMYVAHELAHQWFGNLVTMEWWTHLWLNEGYATFAEFLCVDELFPEYDMWMQFITDTYSPALKLDALKNSHPVEVSIGHPLEVQEIFDKISYHKGASVIRMLHRYIGNDDFAKGMNLYLNNLQYRNATTDDLWEALEEASNKPVSQVMALWTRQMGYPVISVKSEVVGNRHKLYLKQTPFRADGAQIDLEESKVWMIPIEFSSAHAPNEIIYTHLMSTRETIVYIDDIDGNDWIKLNPGCFGFYRVQYSLEMLQMFKKSISDCSLPAVDRLGLLDDLFALVQAGESRTDQVLLLLDSMQNEDNFIVWSSISAVLYKIKRLLEYAADDVQTLFLAFGRRILQQISKTISWDPLPNERHVDKLLRYVILDLLRSFEDEASLEEATKRFESHVQGTLSLCPDIRSTVYRVILSRADATIYEKFLQMYRDETLQEEKERISYVFSSIQNKELFDKVLKFALSDEVKMQTALIILGSMAQTFRGREIVWKYCKENWATLHKNYGAFILPHFITTAFQNFATEPMAEELEDFFATQDTSGVERAIQQTIENIRINAAWLNRDMECIRAYLQSL